MALLLPLAMGSTDCEDFDTVTVPTNDSGAPLAINGVWREGDYVQQTMNDTALTYHLPVGAIVVAVGATWDSGGAKKVSMTREYAWTCCTIASPVVCSTTQSLAAA